MGHHIPVAPADLCLVQGVVHDGVYPFLIYAGLDGNYAQTDSYMARIRKDMAFDLLTEFLRRCFSHIFRGVRKKEEELFCVWRRMKVTVLCFVMQFLEMSITRC